MTILEISHQNKTHCHSVWPVGEIAAEHLLVTITALSSLAGVIGNAFLLIGLVKAKLTQQNTMKVIFSLGVSDMGISLLIMPLFLTIISTKTIDCMVERIIASVNFFFAINTGNMLLILSLDRVLLISWPGFYRKWITVKFTMMVLAGSWIVAAIACVATYFMPPPWILRALLVVAFSYFTMSVASYVRIMRVVHKHKSRVHSQGSGKSGSATDNGNKVGSSGEQKLTRGKSFRALKGKRGGKNMRSGCKKSVTFADTTSPSQQGDHNKLKHSPQNKIVAQNDSGMVIEAVKDDDTVVPSVSDDKANEHNASLESNQGTREVTKTDSKSRGEVGETTSADCGETKTIADSEKSKNGENRFERENNPISTENQNTNPLKIGKIQKSLNRKYEQSTDSSGPSSRPKSTTSSPSPRDSNKLNKATFSKEINVTWTVAIVVGTLFICYIPLVCSGFVWARQEYERNAHTTRLQRSVYAWALSLAYLHSNFNPYIIIARNRVLRRKLKQFISNICNA